MNKVKKVPDSFKKDSVGAFQQIESLDQTKALQNVIQRRKFIGMNLVGFAGLALSSFHAIAHTTGDKIKNSFFSKFIPGKKYWEKTDKFEEKLNLLQSAWERKDYRVVRSLADSLRITTLQAQVADELPTEPVSGSGDYGEVKSLPSALKLWAAGWNYYKVISATTSDNSGQTKVSKPILGYPVNSIPTAEFDSYEPVEIPLGFAAEHVHSLSREIRVAHLKDGKLQEITSQVYEEKKRGNEWFCKLLFMAKSASGRQTFFVFFGNPDAELPHYPTDLITTGEGVGLEIENDFFKVTLSKQTGQLERMTLKRERGLELYAGGEGHGEPAGIDWAHDYVSDGKFQKFRITLWDECPDYEIIRGPVCTIVRRWGFPYSPVHPLFSPSRLNMEIEYRFYSGLPYFHKLSQMKALKDFELEHLRDDEWVFTGQSFTDILWMNPDGKLNIGEVDPNYKDKLWGIGFYSKDNMDSFIGLFLEHRAEGLSELRHSGSPTLFNKWHGQLWSRYPLKEKQLAEGTILYQRNAYITLPFTTKDGPPLIEELRRRMMKPLNISARKLDKDIVITNTKGRLARAGESGDSPIDKKILWNALENCKDGQLIKGGISIVELGLVYDISVKDDIVKVVLAMPHRGRPLGIYFQYGSNTLEVYKGSMNLPEALMQVPGVRKIVMEQSWYPGWTSNLITDKGRMLLELDED